MPLTWTAVWGIAIVLFLVIEGLTVGLASIWFAIGALGAMIISFFGGAEWLQILVFIIISGLTLWLTRPLANRYINSRKQATNADRIIGTTCRVTEQIDNIAGTGAVSAGGKQWTARSQTGEIIAADSLVRALAIEGVKLIVLPEEKINNNFEEER